MLTTQRQYAGAYLGWNSRAKSSYRFGLFFPLAGLATVLVPDGGSEQPVLMWRRLAPLPKERRPPP